MFLVLPRYRLRVSIFAIPAAILMLWCEGVLPFFIMLASALIHEMGHLFALKRLGRTPRRVDILPMGALIVVPEGMPDREEWRVALGGPVASLTVASLCGVGFALCGAIPLLYALIINLILALFNLLPISSLDGGKALLCFLRERIGVEKEKRAERFCSALSVISMLLFSFFSALCVYALGFNLGVVLLTTVLILQLLKA